MVFYPCGEVRLSKQMARHERVGPLDRIDAELHDDLLTMAERIHAELGKPLVKL